MKFVKIYFFIFAALLLAACAQVVAPTGGEKDTMPPKVILSLPENYSKSFAEKRIRIEFNEFVQLSNLQQEFLSSPMLKYIPDFFLRGKSLVMDIQDTLLENTTYTFNFGKGLADFTEGNVLRDYEYVFSTGLILDSLSIRGSLINAIDLTPAEGILIMLYKNHSDSVPYLEKPLYIAKTQSDGSFVLNNLSFSAFKIFALKDQNQNYLFDLPSEEIAFLDSLLMPEFDAKPKPSIDTALVDSLAASTTLIDSTALQAINDSLQKIDSLNNLDKSTKYTMFLFKEDDTSQKLLSSEARGNFMIRFIFKNKVSNPVIRTIDTIYTHNWFVSDFSQNLDTLTYWILNVKQDSLNIEIADASRVLDTVYFKLEQPKQADTTKEVKEGRKKKPKKNLRGGRGGSSRLGFDINVKNNTTFDYFRNVELKSTIPLKKFDFTKIKLYQDTSFVGANIEFTDSLKKNIRISHNWKALKKYRLFVPDSVFYSINDLTNDTLDISFTVSSPDDYANLYLNIEEGNSDYHYILQLLDSKSKLVKEIIAVSPSQIEIPHLKPAEYKLKIIEDKNKNGKWNTGKYIEKLQPERVFLFHKSFNIKAGWDMEETINIRLLK